MDQFGKSGVGFPFTQGDDWDDLKSMARDAVLCHFDDEEAPRVIRLHLVREETIAI